MESKSNLDEDFKLWALLHQARDAVAKARDDELRKVGISMSQAALLSISYLLEPLTADRGEPNIVTVVNMGSP